MSLARKWHRCAAVALTTIMLKLLHKALGSLADVSMKAATKGSMLLAAWFESAPPSPTSAMPATDPVAI